MESLMFRALAFRQRESLETPQKPASLSPKIVNETKPFISLPQLHNTTCIPEGTNTARN